MTLPPRDSKVLDAYHIEVAFLPRRPFRPWRAQVTGQGLGKFSSFPTFYATDEQSALDKAKAWCARNFDRQGTDRKTVFTFNPRGQADA